MDIIIDANILMSALISTKGKTYDLIYNDDIKLFAPEYLIEEFEEHKEEILNKSELSEADFELFLSLIISRIEFIPKNEFQQFIHEAEKIIPDINDIEYFALALKLNCGIWSNDKIFKNQTKVKIYFTSDLINLFKK